MSSFWGTPEIHAANPPESWTVLRVQEGSRVTWHVETMPGQTYYQHATFNTKRAAEAYCVEGSMVERWHREARWFAGDSDVPGFARTYAEVQAEKAQIERERIRKVERAGLAVTQMEQWRSLSEHADPNSVAGALQDFLTDLLDWFSEANPISVDSLDNHEARELYRDLRERWDFGSPVEDKLHRMKYLHVGIEQTAIEALEELARMEAA